jgi:histone deacetylase 6
MKRIHVREAILEEIRLVHAEEQWKRIQDAADYPIEHLEAIAPYYSRHSLYINSSTALSARLSCGSVIDMCRAVAEDRIQNGFAIVRYIFRHLSGINDA